MIQRDVAYFELKNRAPSLAYVALDSTSLMMDDRTYRVPWSGGEYDSFSLLWAGVLLLRKNYPLAGDRALDLDR